MASSALGASPTHTTRVLGPFLFPDSNVIGKGPSGLIAATLWSVKSKFNHSLFNFSRSSSSFFCWRACSFILPTPEDFGGESTA